jgi:hypothetical protein
MKRFNKNDEEIIFENETIYNHGLIEVLQKTLEFNNQLLNVINENKKILEEAKKNGRTEP